MSNLLSQPYSEEHERGILGSVLLSPEVMNGIDLKPNDFYNQKHSKIWQAIIDVRSSGGIFDVISIGKHLKDFNLLDQVGGYEMLLELQDSTLIPSHSQSYAKHVKTLSACRSEIKVLQDGLGLAFDGKRSATSVLAALTSMSDNGEEDLAIDVHAENFVENCKCGEVGHLEWWCPQWTQKLGKLSSELVILHAPRSTGKTAMMLQWITEIHRKDQVAPLVSIEMLKKTLAPRFVANIGQICTFAMKRRGHVTSDEDSRSKSAIEEIRSLDIRVREDEASIDEIFQYAISENNRKKVHAVWVDNLLCINDGGKQYQSKTIMYDAFIKKFRELRNVLGVPVFVLAHPNADGGIAWSKDVENIADIIIYLERVNSEGILLKETGKHVPMNAYIDGKHIIAKFQKNRDGEQPTASLGFVGETQTFTHIGWE